MKPAVAGVAAIARVASLFSSSLLRPQRFADQQYAAMGVVEMLTRRVGVEALDLVHEAVFEERVECPVHGRRREVLALAAGEGRRTVEGARVARR